MASRKRTLGYILLLLAYLSIGALITYTGVNVIRSEPLYTGRFILAAILVGTGRFFLAMSVRNLRALWGRMSPV